MSKPTIQEFREAMVIAFGSDHNIITRKVVDPSPPGGSSPQTFHIPTAVNVIVDFRQWSEPSENIQVLLRMLHADPKEWALFKMFWSDRPPFDGDGA